MVSSPYHVTSKMLQSAHVTLNSIHSALHKPTQDQDEAYHVAGRGAQTSDVSRCTLLPVKFAAEYGQRYNNVYFGRSVFLMLW